MVLTNTIHKQGGKARKVRVTATVTADKSDAGIKVVSSNLKAVVEGLEGLDKGKLQELATGAEKGCPHLGRHSRQRQRSASTHQPCSNSCERSSPLCAR
jgi:hypothetical protein